MRISKLEDAILVTETFSQQIGRGRQQRCLVYKYFTITKLSQRAQSSRVCRMLAECLVRIVVFDISQLFQRHFTILTTDIVIGALSTCHQIRACTFNNSL